MENYEHVYKVIEEMFEQRGYSISSNQEYPELIIAEKNDKKICAFKEVTQKFNIKNFKTCVGFMDKIGINHGIIVYNNITPAVNKLLTNTDDLKCEIETFHVTELSFNPTKHTLVPKHTRVTDEEAKILKKKYEGSQFQIIKPSDPISRFLAFKKGDMIEIVRKGGYVTYRIVK